MDQLSRHIALTMTSTDGRARVITYDTTTYLVTPTGEVWRVFDSEGYERLNPGAPRNDRAVLERTFVGSGDRGVTMVYRFSAVESRSASAQRMLEQLNAAVQQT